MLGFLPTRAYRPGTPGATTFLSPLSGTFNYGWDSFNWSADAAISMIPSLVGHLIYGAILGGLYAKLSSVPVA